MAGELTPHEIYMGLSFVPVILADNRLGRVGIQKHSPMCVDPEVYPNLLLAAPAMYQTLSLLRDKEGDTPTREAIETILAFAHKGYLIGMEIDAVIKGMKQ